MLCEICLQEDKKTVEATERCEPPLCKKHYDEVFNTWEEDIKKLKIK